jgi:hypothetical protein
MYGQPDTPKAVSRQTGLKADRCVYGSQGQVVHSNIMIFFYIMHGVVQVISVNERIFASRDGECAVNR